MFLHICHCNFINTPLTVHCIYQDCEWVKLAEMLCLTTVPTLVDWLCGLFSSTVSVVDCSIHGWQMGALVGKPKHLDKNM